MANPEGRTWARLIDTQSWFDFENPDDTADFFDQTGADPRVSWNASLGDAAEVIADGSYGAAGNSIVILEAR